MSITLVNKNGIIRVYETGTSYLQDTYPVSIFKDAYLKNSEDPRFNMLKMFFLSGQNVMELEIF